MSAVSEFETAEAEQRKAWSAKLVLVVGLQTRDAEERSLTSDGARPDVTAEVHVFNTSDVGSMVVITDSTIFLPGAICISSEMHILYNWLCNRVWFISCFCSGLAC